MHPPTPTGPTGPAELRRRQQQVEVEGVMGCGSGWDNGSRGQGSRTRAGEGERDTTRGR
jgi:hypothetical protein